MDRVTANLKRLAYARVRVEIDAAVKIPKFIEVEVPEGHVIKVFVNDYWMPMKCSMCMIIGHSDKFCSSNGKTYSEMAS